MSVLVMFPAHAEHEHQVHTNLPNCDKAQAHSVVNLNEPADVYHRSKPFWQGGVNIMLMAIDHGHMGRSAAAQPQHAPGNHKNNRTCVILCNSKAVPHDPSFQAPQ